MLHIFEKTNDKYTYKRVRGVSVWIDPNATNIVTQTSEEDDSNVVSNDILSLTLSPSEENVVCSTRRQQLYNLTLSAVDIQGKVSAD